MKIVISSTLTEEQAIILAKEKGYSETLADVNLEFYDNPQSAVEFIKSVYESMIIEDSTRCFIAYDNRLSQSIKEANEKAIKDSVIASISSSVE